MEERGPGYDDWFDEPEPPTETYSGGGRGGYEETEEVWVLPEDEPGRVRAHREFAVGGRTLTTKQVAIIAASLLALFFAILAAAGVFSGGKAAAPTVTITKKPPPVTKPTSTPTVPASTAEAPAQTLTPGDTGSQVKVLQRALAALGYSTGKADGDYGPSTQAAVERFQAANGLAEDGVVGQQTLAAIQKALSG